MLYRIWAVLLAGLVAANAAAAQPPLQMALTVNADATATVAYALPAPTTALHFAQAFAGYRSEDWRPVDAGFRWAGEGSGERLERSDGRRFDRVTLTLPIRYRALPKGYAPFSPFSEGSALIHTGQFHACSTLPCDGAGPLAIAITARGLTIGAAGRRIADRSRYVSRDDGTNIFVGTLAPVAVPGFVTIIDPGLPAATRDHLNLSLPRAMRDFAQIYGPLSFRPELYVSIDARPRRDGHASTQGGTLPGQVFMHFDGANARERVTQGSPFWLDWFFAHEAAHLFQQDQIGKLAGDDQAAWIHEGGADAMAALELAPRGSAERSYVDSRVTAAEAACTKGLAGGPLDTATAAGNFDLHYQCGLLIWLAIDGQLRSAGHDGLHALNKRFFASVKAGAAWDETQFLAAAADAGVAPPLLAEIGSLSHGGYGDPAAAVTALAQWRKPA